MSKRRGQPDGRRLSLARLDLDQLAAPRQPPSRSRPRARVVRHRAVPAVRARNPRRRWGAGSHRASALVRGRAPRHTAADEDDGALECLRPRRSQAARGANAFRRRHELRCCRSGQRPCRRRRRDLAPSARATGRRSDECRADRQPVGGATSPPRTKSATATACRASTTERSRMPQARGRRAAACDRGYPPRTPSRREPSGGRGFDRSTIGGGTSDGTRRRAGGRRSREPSAQVLACRAQRAQVTTAGGTCGRCLRRVPPTCGTRPRRTRGPPEDKLGGSAAHLGPQRRGPCRRKAP